MVNNTSATDRRNANVMERHFGTVVAALTLAAIIWAGNRLIVQSEAQIKMVGIINVMNTEIQHLKIMVTTSAKDRYTSMDADEDLKIITYQIDSLTRRVNHLETANEKNIK